MKRNEEVPHVAVALDDKGLTFFLCFSVFAVATKSAKGNSSLI